MIDPMFKKQLDDWSLQITGFRSILIDYNDAQLNTLMSTLTESGLLAKCLQQDEIVFVFRSLAPLPASNWRASQQAEFIQTGLLKIASLIAPLCATGKQVCMLLNEMRRCSYYSPLDSLQALSDRGYEMLTIALLGAVPLNQKVVSRVEEQLIKRPSRQLVLQNILDFHGEHSPLSLHYFQLALKACLAELEQVLLDDSTESKSTQVWLRRIAAAKNFNHASMIHGRLTLLLEQPALIRKRVLLWFKDSDLWDKPAAQNQFNELMVSLNQFPKEALPAVLDLMPNLRIIHHGSDYEETRKTLTALKAFSAEELKGISAWFKQDRLPFRCRTLSDLLHVFAMIKRLLDRGAQVDAKGLSGLTPDLSATDDGLASDDIFYAVEQHLSVSGTNWLSTSGFGEWLAHCYRTDNLDDFPRWIFSPSKLAQNRPMIAPIAMDPPVLTVIHNNQDYDTVDAQLKASPSDQVRKGNHFPQVGYNIHIPQGMRFRSILIGVYGGYNSVKDAFIPGKLGLDEIGLLHKGVVCVRLNLPDLLHLKVFQGQMPDNLHELIHSSIDAFYQRLTQAPESLHESLACLRGLDVFLWGASFGGRTAVRHGQLFPNTFTGYTSHDGALNEYALPLNAGCHLEIAKMSRSDRVLLLHNADDNIVLLNESLQWFRKAQTSLRTVQLSVFDHGSPFAKKGGSYRDKSQDEEMDDEIYRGHFRPEEPRDLTHYIDTIFGFMVKAPQRMSAVSRWRAHRYEFFSLRNKGIFGAWESFLNEALQLFRKDFVRPQKDRFKCSPVGLRDPMQQDQAWDMHFEPLLRAIVFAERLIEQRQKRSDQAIAALFLAEQLTDDHIDRALMTHLPQFIDYLMETEKGFAAVNSSLFRLSEGVAALITPSLRARFKKTLLSVFASDPPFGPQKEMNALLIRSWFIGNPHWVTKNMQPIAAEDLIEAKKGVIAIVKTYCRRIQWARQQVIKEAVEQIQSQTAASQVIPEQVLSFNI